MMNANIAVKIVVLGAYAVAISDSGFEIPAEVDAEIDELIEAADDFASSMTDAESDGAILAQLTEMLGAIKAELSGQVVDTVTIPRAEYDSLAYDSGVLGCLEACGVDNWGGWDGAMELFAQTEAA